MRLLFVMLYPGYLRYFDSVIEELTARGHHVDLVWNMPSRQAEGLVAIERNENVRVHALPKRGQGLWGLVGRRLELTIYFVRYLDRRFASASYLRRRAGERIPWPFRRLRTLPDRVVRLLLDLLVRLDRTLPRPEAFDRFLDELRPDAVVVSPLVTKANPQALLVAAARERGVPTAAAVASWDNLTCKSIVTVPPDRMIVWNETQRTEAKEYHRFSPERVVVTGAQCFDRWFHRSPSRDRSAFCAHAGLPADPPFLLFVGSTASISSPGAEVNFVREWLRRLRDDPTLARTPVLIRPHPYNSAHWDGIDLGDVGDVSIFPRGGANPVAEVDRADFFDSLYHACVVVGVNTSAMIEAAIVGRPVLTVTDPEFHDSQLETMHFHYLLPENGGFVRAASSIAAHLEQLRALIADPELARPQITEFVSSFIRPQGLDRPATPILADVLELLPGLQPEPDPPAPWWQRAALWPLLSLVALLELPGLARRALRRRARRREKRRARRYGATQSSDARDRRGDTGEPAGPLDGRVQGAVEPDSDIADGSRARL